MSDGRVADREPEKGHLGAPGRVWLAFLTGTLLLFLARSAIRGGPVLVADEVGYLGNARAIAGGIGAQLELAPVLNAALATAAAYPATTVLSQAEMSENALFPLACVWLICFAGLLSADRDESLWRLRSRQSP